MRTFLFPGHYSVLEPDGTVRSVEYTAGPKTGFTAVVNNDGIPPPQPDTEPETGRSFMEDKTMRDYGKYYDFADDIEDDYYERKRGKFPYDPFREAPPRKRPSFDQEPSEYTHSVTIKHPRDDASQDSSPHSHVGYSFDPNCKTKTKKESNDGDSYANIVYLDQNKQKYPGYHSEPYRDSYDKYSESSNYAFDRVKPYESHKIPKYEDHRSETSMKYHYQTVADIPRPEKYYPEDNIPSRPKKNRRPPKVPEFVGEDMDDYILVPKKKYKPSRRPSEPIEYRPEFDDEFDRPYGYDDEDRYRPVRDSTGPEVVRKVVKKKKKPVVNLLDIFDI